jgi:hypothetical protein
MLFLMFEFLNFCALRLINTVNKPLDNFCKMCNLFFNALLLLYSPEAVDWIRGLTLIGVLLVL